MYCSILPYSRSFDDTLLTYGLPDAFRPFVKVGSSVQIPWGNETIIGIVADMGREIPYDGEVKDITRPHCTVPWLSASEIALVLELSRMLFMRIHTILQLFIPQGVFGLFEKENFLDLTPPVIAQKKGISDYVIAPTEEAMKKYLSEKLTTNPGAVILPEGLSVKSWSTIFPDSVVDTHAKSISTQKKIYLDILSGKEKTLFGTRRTLLKRLGHYPDIYVLHENLSEHIFFGQRSLPLWMLLGFLENHGHIIHYIGLTPSLRTMTDFLTAKKPIEYI